MNKETNQQQEFENVDQTMRNLLRVPHSEIKERLEAEKIAKNRMAQKRMAKNGDKGKK